MPKHTLSDPPPDSGVVFKKQWDVWEKHIHSFVELSKSADQTQNDVSDKEHVDLSDVTVAVKDIIDVAGLRTRNGSAACCSAAPAKKDAPVVASLRAAGARIVGKTTTTEFAFTDPTDCRNPYDTHRTPGGSSSGSGAAVTAGLVDIALGTQTAGSLIRPAAYCGVVGFKPTHGVLSTNGITPLAPSFDTVGIIAKSVKFAERAFAAMHASYVPRKDQDLSGLSAIASLFPIETGIASEALAAFQDAKKSLKQTVGQTQNSDVLANVDRIVANHRLVMNFEAFAKHRGLLAGRRWKLLQPKFLAGLRAGEATAQFEFDNAVFELAEATKMFWEHLSNVDIVLTLPVPDGAPLIDGTTGFQDWLTPWTVFGGPLITLPWGLDSLGRPRAVMLAAHPHHDNVLLAMASALEKLAPPLPPPSSPSGG
ncbi:MAG: amidase [Hyphomicrobiales bacterium]